MNASELYRLTGRQDVNEAILLDFCRVVYEECKLMQGLRAKTERVPDIWRGGKFQYEYKFTERMNQLADEMGLVPERFGKVPSIRIYSYARLKAIWKLQESAVLGYSGWLQHQDIDILNAAPAQELIVIRSSAKVEPWRELWRQAIDDLHGLSTAMITADARMIARKHDPIWAHINQFGLPWTPFDFGREATLRSIRWREAVALGYLDDEHLPKDWTKTYQFDWSFDGFMKLFLHPKLTE